MCPLRVILIFVSILVALVALACTLFATETEKEPEVVHDACRQFCCDRVECRNKAVLSRHWLILRQDVTYGTSTRSTGSAYLG